MTATIATDTWRENLDAAIAALPDTKTADALIERYIRKDGVRSGRHAARAETETRSVHVWALIGHLRGGGGIAQAAEDYRLPEEAVIAAVAFYAKYRPYIDAFLLINEDIFDDWDEPNGVSK